jgi:hypothetical protein
LNGVFPDVEYSNWPLCGRLIPHAQALASLIDEYGFDFPEAARLMNQAGSYLQERAQYTEAEPLLKRALDITTTVVVALVSPEYVYSARALLAPDVSFAILTTSRPVLE